MTESENLIAAEAEAEAEAQTAADEEAIFHEIKGSRSCAFSDPYIKQYLSKWDITRNMRFHQFRYTKAYHKMASDEFLIDMFNDTNVQKTLQVLNGRDTWVPASGKVKAVSSEVIPATLTRMDLFDKLSEADPEIVRGNNSIMKCMEDVVDGFTISDQLRELLVKGDESENCDLFSDEEKSEFLFQIFQNLVLGGSMNQFEDEIESYLDITKKLYKEMLSVQKNALTGKVEVASPIFRITDIENEAGWSLFPAKSKNNFAYVSMDPMRRMCRIWYHAFVPYW